MASVLVQMATALNAPLVCSKPTVFYDAGPTAATSTLSTEKRLVVEGVFNRLPAHGAEAQMLVKSSWEQFPCSEITEH